MLILAYLVICGKCKTVVKTTIVEKGINCLSDGCLTKIVDLRAAGHNPYFIDQNGDKVRIPKRLPTVGVYNGIIPVHKPEEMVGGRTKFGKPNVLFISAKKRDKDNHHLEVVTPKQEKKFRKKHVDRPNDITLFRLITPYGEIEHESLDLIQHARDVFIKAHIPVFLSRVSVPKPEGYEEKIFPDRWIYLSKEREKEESHFVGMAAPTSEKYRSTSNDTFCIRRFRTLSSQTV